MDSALFLIFFPRPAYCSAFAEKTLPETRSEIFVSKLEKPLKIRHFSAKNDFFLKKIAFFFVFPLDNAQLWGYIWLTLNLEECP